MNRIVRRIAVTGLAASALALSAAPAFAHECYNANRSTQGAVSAGTHSKIWSDDMLSDADLFGFMGLQFSAEQLAQIDAVLAAEHVASTIVIGGGSPFEITCDEDYICTSVNPGGHDTEQAGGQGGDIADSMPDKNKADGKGIDHLGDGAVVFEAWVAAYDQVVGLPL